MDSLLASYASSDEEEQPPPQRIPPAKPGKSELKAEESSSKRGGILGSLPAPKSSLFNSLPPPKSQSLSNPNPQSEVKPKLEADERGEQIAGNSKSKSSSSKLFSSLPQPKTAPSSAATKRTVVQFRPPTITHQHLAEDEDSDDGEEERKRKRSRESVSTTSAASFFSSIPAPRHSATLGALPSGSGMGRRSIVETEAPSSNVSTANAIVDHNAEYSNHPSVGTDHAYSSWGSESENHEYYSGNGAAPNVNVGSASGSDASLGGESYAYYGAYSAGTTDVNGGSTDYEAVDYSYAHGHHLEHTDYGGDYGNNTQYENNWENSTALPEVSGMVENALPVFGRRGRKDIPPEIIEVKQDELMKNRPREDQVKATGIAFGPAYQPASTKGKPTKLHKRKHQIGSLYFDMRQKETELAERRSKGFLTKAQTQAKYGW